MHVPCLKLGPGKSPCYNNISLYHAPAVSCMPVIVGVDCIIKLTKDSTLSLPLSTCPLIIKELNCVFYVFFQIKRTIRIL